MIKTLKLFLSSEDGQTSTEYILLVAVAALLVFRFKDIAADRLQKITNKVFENADRMATDMGSGS
ncbi:MAG: hypothetical protein HQK50_04275 [Oligoflexia bacterium]|nr:hypothetical protein [Oligoflexia bacterium]MBF0364761.1 hypothetical protein [Oligoflexia bacterium]